MREVELQYDSSSKVYAVSELVPLTGASVQVVGPSGAAIQSQEASIPLTNTTTSTGSTATVLVLNDASAVRVGDTLRVVSWGNSYACEVSSVDGDAVTLVTGLPVAPEDGSAVYGCNVEAVIAPTDAANIGPNYRLLWTLTANDRSMTLSQTASVVRWLWTPVVTAKDVRDILSELNQTRSEQWCQGVADRVDEVIQAKLLSTGRRPWLYLSSMVFYDAARTGIRYELSQRGVAFGGQIYEAQRELRFAFDDKLAQVIQGLQGIKDDNGDGIIDPAEAKPKYRTLQVYR